MSWYRVVNMDSGERSARIDIYDDIGEFTDWWTGEKSGIAARDFSATLQALGNVDSIELHINSRGGSVPDGLQIYNELKRHEAKITVVIDGQAASIASIIALAGDEVVMPANTTLWIHNPITAINQWIEGNSKDLREIAQKVLNVADDLETTEALIVNMYLSRANDKLSREELVAMLDKETTITAEQAVEWGLADRIEESVQQAACFDMKTLLSGAEDHFKATLKAVGPKQPSDPELPKSMTAKAVITACRDSGFEMLATSLIESGASEKTVKQQLELAKDVKDMAVASGVEAELDSLVAAATTGTLEAMRAALSINMEAQDTDIDNNLSLSSNDDVVQGPNPTSIYNKRKQRG